MSSSVCDGTWEYFKVLSTVKDVRIQKLFNTKGVDSPWNLRVRIFTMVVTCINDKGSAKTGRSPRGRSVMKKARLVARTKQPRAAAREEIRRQVLERKERIERGRLAICFVVRKAEPSAREADLRQMELPSGPIEPWIILHTARGMQANEQACSRSHTMPRRLAVSIQGHLRLSSRIDVALSRLHIPAGFPHALVQRCRLLTC